MLTANAPTSPVAWVRTMLDCPDGAAPDCISSPLGVAQQTNTQIVDGTQAGYALDIGATCSPWVQRDVRRRPTTTMDITVTGSGTVRPVRANLRYARGQTIYTWRVFGPIAQSHTFPTLPATLPGNPTIRRPIPSPLPASISASPTRISGYRDAIKNPYARSARANGERASRRSPSLGTTNRLSSSGIDARLTSAAGSLRSPAASTSARVHTNARARRRRRLALEDRRLRPRSGDAQRRRVGLARGREQLVAARRRR